MKTLIIGASGKIGKFFSQNKYIYTYNKNKIKNGIKFNLCKDNIKILIKKYKISKVVFLSAISNTDTCYKNPKSSYKINVKETISTIKKLIDQKIYIIFFSTEFVFSGKKGDYLENDITKPINIYGKQKLLVENFLKKNYSNFSILRIAKTYSENITDGTIINEFLNNLAIRKKIFISAEDQIFNPLYVRDLIKIVNFFLKKEIKGIFNVGGPQKLSRFQINKKILQTSKHILPKNYNPKIKKISLNKIKFIERRPKNVSFNIKKLKKTINFNLTYIDEIIDKSVKKYASKIN